jgi:hypothetical protein
VALVSARYGVCPYMAMHACPVFPSWQPDVDTVNSISMKFQAHSCVNQLREGLFACLLPWISL